MTLQNYYEKMGAANFRMRLFAPAQNGAQWRIFWRCFSEFFRKWSSSAVFPHAVSQVRGQLPHKSGDNPLPCAIFVVPLHSHSALESHSRYRSTKSAGDQGLCSPQKSKIFGGPNGDAPHAHRTFIALSPHTRARVAAMRRSSSAKARLKKNKIIQD